MKDRQNQNTLKSTQPLSLFEDILAVIIFSSLYPHADERISHCIFASIKGIHFPSEKELSPFLIKIFERLAKTLYDDTAIDKISMVGRRLAVHLHGECTSSRTNISQIELDQSKLIDKNDSFTFISVLAGESIGEKAQVDKLTKPPFDISQAVFRILDELRPKPLESVVRTPDWLDSVFANLRLKDIDVLAGIE